jgi:hypothetical protein
VPDVPDVLLVGERRVHHDAVEQPLWAEAIAVVADRQKIHAVNVDGCVPLAQGIGELVIKLDRHDFAALFDRVQQRARAS